MLINKTPYGKVFICDSCNQIHLEFLNIQINFNQDEYENFLVFISNLDVDKWEKRNANNQFNRKIFISFKNSKISLALYKHEFEFLKNLLLKNLEKIQLTQHIKIKNFDITYFNN